MSSSEDFTDEAILRKENADLKNGINAVKGLINDMYEFETQPLFRISGLSDSDIQKYLSLTAQVKFKISRL